MDRSVAQNQLPAIYQMNIAKFQESYEVIAPESSHKYWQNSKNWSAFDIGTIDQQVCYPVRWKVMEECGKQSDPQHGVVRNLVIVGTPTHGFQVKAEM